MLCKGKKKNPFETNSLLYPESCIKIFVYWKLFLLIENSELLPNISCCWTKSPIWNMALGQFHWMLGVLGECSRAAFQLRGMQDYPERSRQASPLLSRGSLKKRSSHCLGKGKKPWKCDLTGIDAAVSAWICSWNYTLVVYVVLFFQ